MIIPKGRMFVICHDGYGDDDKRGKGIHRTQVKPNYGDRGHIHTSNFENTWDIGYRKAGQSMILH